jgi:hypothetical protein
MNIDELMQNLAPTSTNPERVRALLRLDLTPKMLAHATGCQSLSTLRNWSTGQTQPREDAALALDDLRLVALTLLQAGLAPERVGRWFASRDPERFGGMRPFERFVVAPMEVLSAAQGDALRTRAEQQPPLVLVGEDG